MKLLLDENLPHDLRHELRGHDVYTVRFMGWTGLSNGALLAQAAATGFHALITLDSAGGQRIIPRIEAVGIWRSIAMFAT